MSGLGTKLFDAVESLREEEIRAARPFRIMGAVSSAIAQIPLLISPVAAFALFTVPALKDGVTLDATRMFSSLSLVILLGAPLFWMLETVMDMFSAIPCFSRIQ